MSQQTATAPPSKSHAPRRVGIYGGSFNPIHNGHLALAEAFLKACALDEVWFVVSPQNPFKADSRLLDDDTRLRLTRMAVEQRHGLRVSDVEFGLPRPSYMWNTLQILSHDHPDNRMARLGRTRREHTLHRPRLLRERELQTRRIGIRLRLLVLFRHVPLFP